MIVVAIIGLLAAIAVPAIRKARAKTQRELCMNNRRIIWEQINVFCMETTVGMTRAEWPNLCACRNRLSPGGEELYVKSWDVFECPVSDSQDRHDYRYVWDANDVMVDIVCNNRDLVVRAYHQP